MPYQGYNGASSTAVQVRERIIARLSGDLVISSQWRQVLVDSADAVDAVVSAFAAKAVAEGNLYVRPQETEKTEGWIAIHR